MQGLGRGCRSDPWQAARLLTSWSTSLGLCVGQLTSVPGVHPPEVSGVGPQSANLGVGNQASGEHWGCLSRIHSPGAEGGGAPEVAAVESSLTSR